MAESNTDIVSYDDGITERILSLKGGNAAVYNSMKGDDEATREIVYAATTSSLPIMDHLDKVINLRNVIVSVVEISDEETGEVSKSPRIILIDDKNKAYHALSFQLLSALENFFGIFGEPDSWSKARPIKVVEERSRKGRRFYTIRLA